MTESEWLDCADLGVMLELLRECSDRKRRLFACACCETFRRYFDDERSLAAVAMAYRVADGIVSEEDREAVFAQAYAVATWPGYHEDGVGAVAAYTVGTSDQVNEVPWMAIRVFGFDI